MERQVVSPSNAEDHSEVISGRVLDLVNNITVVLEKTLESPLDCKEIQPVHPKGNQT